MGGRKPSLRQLCKALVRSGGLLKTWRASRCTQHLACGSHARRITDVYSLGKPATTGARAGICCTHFRAMAWGTQMALFVPSGMLRFDQIRRGRHFSCGHDHPVNLALPAGLRGRGLPPVTVVVLRAGCDESRLSGSTEAHRSNPLAWMPESNPGVLSDAEARGNAGDADRPRCESRPVWVEGGAEVCASKSPCGVRWMRVHRST